MIYDNPLRHTDQETLKVNDIDHYFIGMSSDNFPLIATMPHDQELQLPQNPKIKAGNDAIVVAYENNGRFQNDPFKEGQLKEKDISKKGTMQTITFNGEEYDYQIFMKKRRFLLDSYFESTIGNKDTVSKMASMNTAAGLGEGEYLYRAIGQGEYYKMKMKQVPWIAPGLIGSNFETQEMFDSEQSQVKYFANKDEYSNAMIRFKFSIHFFSDSVA